MISRAVVIVCLVGLSCAALSDILGAVDDIVNPDELINIDLADTDKAWKVFRKFSKKQYKNADEEKFRLGNFKKNMDKLKELKKTHKDLGINALSDLDDAEINIMGRGLRKSRPSGEPTMPIAPPRFRRQTLPPAFDWRATGKVTPVKNQGQCGSCWAFAAAAVIESAVLIGSNVSTDLSEQEITNCVSQAGGCNGGWGSYALQYARTVGVGPETGYPYTSGSSGAHGACTAPAANKRFLTNWYYVASIAAGQPDDTTIMNAVVTRSPLFFGMWVPTSFNYLTSTSGVYSPTAAECQAAATSGYGHAVVIIGYGTENGVNYWLVRNSWGTGWGNAGYFKINRAATACWMGEPLHAASIKPTDAYGCTNVNQDDDCKYWNSLGYCATTSQYANFMTTNCKAECNRCASG